MDYDVQLEQVQSIPLAVVRLRASIPELPTVIPAACGKVWSIVKAQNITGAGRHIALYWDEEINLEVGVELATPFVGHGEVVASATPAGTVARVIHYGPYQQLAAAHQAIHQWCANHGYTLAGPCWEIYDHWKDEWNQDPSQIRTDVFYLVKTDGSAAG
jgi:effector-binding domain-containing protein